MDEERPEEANEEALMPRTQLVRDQRIWAGELRGLEGIQRHRAQDGQDLLAFGI